MSKGQYSYSAAPSVKFPRNLFKCGHTNTLSMNVGKLYPVDLVEVTPGSTWKGDMNFAAKLSSAFARPIMDNLQLEIRSFFVPLRILYDGIEDVFGSDKTNPWNLKNNATMPVTPTVSDVYEDTVGDFLGLPVNKNRDGSAISGLTHNNQIPIGINILPFRAFAMIWDQFYRSESYGSQPMNIQKGAYNVSEAINNNAWSVNNYTGKLPPVNKTLDYFTSCFANTQKGPAQGITIGQNGIFAAGISPMSPSESVTMYVNDMEPGFAYGELFADTGMDKSPLTVDLNPITVNDIRLAFAMQKMLERDALYGTRYREYLYGHFGVDNSDARMQVPEYLGGVIQPLGVQQVAQTAPTSGTDYLGQLGGYSQSADYKFGKYYKSFTEHGYIIRCACIKQHSHTYAQGINKLWMRSKRNEYYDPLFAHLGYSPVFLNELYGSTSRNNDTALRGRVFGYTEAFAELRAIPNTVHGQMRPTVSNNYKEYMLTDTYASTPSLNGNWLNESDANVTGRILATPATYDPFIVQIRFNDEAIQVLPLYGTPALVDHG